MLDQFVAETLQTLGPPLRWPFFPYEILAELVSNFDNPVFRGQGVRYGDGKPLLVVPGHLSGDDALTPLNSGCAGSATVPRGPGLPINLSDDLIDEPLAKALRSSARRIGRKAVFIAFGTGVRAALRVAAADGSHVSDVIALDLPDRLPVVPASVRLHVIGSRPLPAEIDAELWRVEGSRLLLHVNPEALRSLSEILRKIPIALPQERRTSQPD